MQSTNRVATIIGLGVAAFGAIFLGIALFFIIDVVRFRARARPVTGTVIELEWRDARDPDGFASTSSYPVVRYVDGGRTVVFKSSIGSRPAAYSVGQSVPVLCPPTDAESARIDSLLDLYLLPGVFGLLGSIAFLAGGLVLVLPRLWRRRTKYILANGLPLKAVLTAVRLDTHVSINEQHPWILVAEPLDPSFEVRTLTSRRLWTDPTARYRVGTEVTVYYLPEKPTAHEFVFDDTQLPTGNG